MNLLYAIVRPMGLMRLALFLCIFAVTAVSTARAEPNARAAALLSALDLTQPALAPVNEALQKGGSDLALKAFADYLRTRTEVHWRENPDGSGKAPPHFTPAIAEAAADGKVQGGLVSPIYPFPAGNIDWFYNATSHTPGTAFDSEWQWQLNRMGFWFDLAGAYSATGDERYARAFVQQMRSWITQCPVPDHEANGSPSAWRTIEVGIRMGESWPEAYFAFLHSPSLSDDDLIAMAGSFLEQGRYLRRYQTSLNWLTMEMSGLYAVGTLFPEFREAAEWRHYAVDRLTAEVPHLLLPDGACMELSTGYQNVILDNFLHIAEIARWNNRSGELSPAYNAGLEQAYAWDMALLAPDRTLPKLNDSWTVRASEVFRKASASFPKRDDFRWFYTDGKEGAAPAWTSTLLDRSGFAVMRSGWDRAANYLVFRVGPVGAGHQHQDALDVLLWSYGREVVFSAGGASYEQSKWRKWAISTFGSSGVIVDGLSQARVYQGDDPLLDPNRVSQGPIDAKWQSNPIFDSASGIYDQAYGPDHLRPAIQRRDVLFLKPDLFVVADRLTPTDGSSHCYQARWQLLTTHTEIDPATHVLVTTDLGVSNLAIVPLMADGLETTATSGQETPEILGWSISHEGLRVPATTLLHTRTGIGPQTFLTLFIPLRPGQTNPVARVEAEADGSSATAFFHDGRRIRISYAEKRGIEAGEILPDGSAGRTNQTSAP